MITKYNPIKYFIYTFIFTIIFWTLGAYFSFKETNNLHGIFLLLGLITPFLVAIFLIYKDKKYLLAQQFKKKFFNIKDIDKYTLVFMVFIMPVSIFLSICISLLFGESAEQFNISNSFSFSSAFIPVIFLLLIAATFEELGWRGYGFESLEGKFNFLVTSVIFSILWSAWHIPLIFVNQSYQYNIFHENIVYVINFYISIIPMGIIISWVWIKNNRNIIIAIIFHFIINISQEALEITQVTKIIQTLVLVVFAIIIIYFDKKLFFKKKIFE